MRLRASNAIAACTVAALATVLSVQQGEHGPLVVYKLQVPGEAEPAARPPAPQLDPAAEPVAEPLYVIPSRAPSVLGTVEMPAASTPLVPPSAQTPMSEQEGFVSLQDVTDEVMWRRETVESLPQAPFAPPF